MQLIIVESPTKAKTLSRFLGEGFTVAASMGHVRDLPEKRLGIDTDHDFAPEYVITKGKEGVVRELRDLTRKVTKIILATDPDREGEAIAWHISHLLAVNSRPLQGKQLAVSRITFHEITESAIKDALTNPGTLNMQLVDAQQARRILDRLVGYKLSPVLWRKVRRGLSAGRVQSVAVRLIVEKEREIQKFKAEEYWEIAAQFSGFEAKLIKQEIHNKEEADKIISELEKAEYKVSNVQTKEVKRSPYPPFTTSTLQQAASNLFGWSAKRTMQIAQSLYEQGLITYHRTDSMNLAGEAVNAVRAYINKEYGQNYLPESSRFYKTKSKVAQEAHEAIRPTAAENQVLSIKYQGLDRDQVKLYELIWKRFVACQMTEAIYRQTAIDITAGDYLFKATGSKVIFEGWQKLYERLEVSSEQLELPKLTIGEILELLKLIPSQHFTEAPTRYTEASLIKTLEEYGIGRPSTYAPTLSTIQERQYVEKEDKKLIPTSLGFAVTDFLMANFANILDYKFTAGMENNLDAIANGEKQWVPVVRDFYEPFSQRLMAVQETAPRVKIKAETTGENCPQCQSPLVVRIGRFGKFIACSKFPECKYTAGLIQKLENIKCPKCGGDVVIKKTKSKRSFYGCSNYPKCDWASWVKPK